MAQFQVYRNPRGSRQTVPFLMDVQSDLVETASRLVVPLVLKQSYGALYTRLNPEFTIDQTAVVAAISDLAAVDARELREIVGNLATERSRILAAIDFLLTGY